MILAFSSSRLLQRVPATGVLAALLLALPASATHAAETDSSPAPDPRLEEALAGPARSAANRARDAYRHPAETLAFFGLRPDQRVLELWPGSGWYTEILAPYLKERGRLTVTNFDPDGPEDRTTTRLARELGARLEADPETFGAVEVIRVDPPEHIDLGADASYDLVLTFRNNHGWINAGYEERMYAEAFRVLVPGGVLGVVQHRAPAGADPVTSAKRGYVPEAHIIALAERAGFELADRSEVNANPADDHDHPEGVWTLPPTLRLGDQDRDRYLAIGESDRMTLRLVKPRKEAEVD